MRWSRENRIERLVIVNWLRGAVLGILAAAAVLFSDAGHVRTLLVASDAVLPGLALLFAGFAILFAGVLSASAIMSVPDR